MNSQCSKYCFLVCLLSTERESIAETDASQKTALGRLHHDDAGAEVDHDVVSAWLELVVFALQFAVGCSSDC